MKFANYLCVILLMISILFNVGFDYNPAFLGSVSLKNISIYSIVLLLLLQQIFATRSEAENHRISCFICIYILYSLFLLVFKKIQVDEYSNFIELIIAFKSGFDAFLIFVLIDYLILDNKQLDYLIFYLVLIFFIFNVVTVLDSLEVISIDKIEFDHNYGRSDGAFGESNVYASYVSCFIPLVIVFMLNAKNAYFLLFVSSNLILAIYALLLTGSRTGFLSIIISIVFLFFITRKNHVTHSLSRYVGFVLVVLVSVIVIVKTISNVSLEGLQKNLVTRYESSDLNDYSSGRVKLWKKGLQLFAENPLFGVQKGFSETIGSNTHNAYLEVLVDKGFFGFFIFMFILWLMFKKSFYFYNVSNKKFIYSGYIAGFVSFIVSMFFLNMFSSYYFFFLYSSLIHKKGYLESNNL